MIFISEIFQAALQLVAHISYSHVATVLQLAPAAQDGAVLTRNLHRFNPSNGMDMRQEKLIDREYIL